MSTKFKGQRHWIREVLNKYEELEKQIPKSLNEDPEWPEWVWNLWLILLRIGHPGLKVKKGKKWKAKDVGQFLGRQYALDCLMWGAVPLSSQVLDEEKRFIAGMEERARQARPDVDLDKLQKQFEQGMSVWRPKFKKFMQEALSSACERPYIEASAFFEAFGKAIVIKPDDLLTERTMGVGDKLCWAMVMSWQAIGRLHSVGELHRIFEQALKPHGVILKRVRIEKLCQRIKLRFRGPGRPSGSKTQTNPTSV